MGLKKVQLHIFLIGGYVHPFLSNSLFNSSPTTWSKKISHLFYAPLSMRLNVLIIFHKEPQMFSCTKIWSSNHCIAKITNIINFKIFAWCSVILVLLIFKIIIIIIWIPTLYRRCYFLSYTPGFHVLYKLPNYLFQNLWILKLPFLCEVSF